MVRVFRPLGALSAGLLLGRSFGPLASGRGAGGEARMALDGLVTNRTR